MKLCVRDFSMLALKDPLFPAEVVVIGTSTTPPTAGVTLRRHQHCTNSQRSCSGFNFMLVYLSVRLVPVFFSVVYLQVSEHILWYSLLLCHQHWRDASNQALRGKVFCSPFPSSVSCCARVFPPHLSILAGPFWAFLEHVPAPPIVPISTSPHFFRVPRRAEPPHVRSVPDQPV